MILLLSIFSSCDWFNPEDEDPLVIDNTKYGRVTPTSAKLGTLLRFFSLDSTDYPLEEYKVLFTGMNDLVTFDSLTTEGVYTTLPFGAISGTAKIVHHEVDSSDFVEGVIGSLFPIINCDTVFINGFRVTELSSVEDPRLTWSDLNYTITKSHSQYWNGTPDDEIIWNGEVNGDTTWLSTTYSIDDVDYEHYLTFYSIRGDSILPELMNAYSRSTTMKTGVRNSEFDYFFEGIIKLQEWRSGNMVSGRIISPLGDLNNYHFWCDFSDEYKVLFTLS
jgi:hypothetical protein